MLSAPKGLRTRPTSDMVRESLFNILQGELEDSRIVDLFSGSGAFGLEALSRGAERAWFVDSSRDCELIIKKNLERCRFGSDRAEVIRSDVFEALRQLSGTEADIIFADPPYGQENAFLCRLIKMAGSVIKNGGVFILEQQKSEPDSPEIDGFSVYRVKTYSNTKVIFLKHYIEEQDEHCGLPGQL